MIYTHITFIFQWKTMEEDSNMLAFVLIYLESGNTELRTHSSLGSLEKWEWVGGRFELSYQEQILDKLPRKVNFK